MHRYSSTAIFVVLWLAVVPGSSFAQSSRSGWGATPYADSTGTGVTFRVWAPNATSVQLLGDFNSWQYGTYLVNEGTGIWSLDVGSARSGQEYKYVINNTLWRKDPRARRISGSNSSIYNPNAFDWASDSFIPPAKSDLVLYELHIGSFYDPIASDSQVATFEDAIEKLDYLADLGVNCIELMPVATFPGDRSWGYNPVDIFAVESSYGGPDQLKEFVKASHEHGIAVYLDIVHNHYDAQNSDCPLWEFDGWNGGGNYGGIYFYQENGKCCTIWGRRPHYGRTQVQNFIRDNITMWLDEFHIDGFRWDSPINIKFYDSTFNSEGYNLAYSINQSIKDNYSNHYSIGEDQDLDMNFDAEWHDSFHYNIVDQLTKSSDTDRSMSTVQGQVTDASGLYRVIYVESHDKVGKLNNANRLVTQIDSADPTSYWARKRAALGAVLTLTSPGIPLLFMGQEWFESEAFDDYDPLDWTQADANLRGCLLFKHLIRLRRNLDGGTAGLKGTGVNAYHVNDSGKVMAFHRWNTGGTGDDVVVVANFSVTQFTSYDLDFPYAGTWYAHFNSDWKLYGTNFSNYGTSQVSVPYNGATVSIQLAPYSALIFSRTPPPSRDADGDGMLDSWEEAHGLNSGNSADALLDPDGDGLNNSREFELQTDPQTFDAFSNYSTMSLAGTMNDWDLLQTPMSLTSHYSWAAVRLVTSSDLHFKFAANTNWATCWGDANQTNLNLPFSGVGDPGGDETPIHATNALVSNTLYFAFIETNLAYRVEILPTNDVDGDGMNDAWETFYGLDPHDATDATSDPDGDESSNLQEFLNGSHPRQYTQKLHDYQTMHIAGTFNHWSTTRSPMKLYDDYNWQAILHVIDDASSTFKYIGNSSWIDNWGDNSQTSTTLPLNDIGVASGANIRISGTLNGVYQFRFNERTAAYQLEALAAKDADGDGMHDEWEMLNLLNPSLSSDANEDPDHDGLSNLIEFEYGSDPHTADPLRANYSSMAMAGTLNNWSPTNTLMSLTDHFTWQILVTFSNEGLVEFKFTADHSWTDNWGDNDPSSNRAPLFSVADSYGSNIAFVVERAGDYRFTFNDRTLQYNVEFVPRSTFDKLNVPGTFNGWDPTAFEMQLVDNHVWELQTLFSGETNVYFKFVAENDWNSNWGETNPTSTSLPLFGSGDSFGGNIAVSEPLSGRYRFRFNDETLGYSFVALSETDTDDDGIPDRWETLNGLNSTNAADALNDDDHDGMNNVEEYLADTDPGDSNSCLLIHRLVATANGLSLEWQGGSACWQYLMVASPTNLSSWRVIATNEPPTAGTSGYTNAYFGDSSWYRIKAARTPPD